jgi:hypothetical protein
LECAKAGIPRRGITHDLSKLLPSEFFPYAKEFNGDRKSKPEYYDPLNTGNSDFDFAWLLHQKRNRHHWQWWILPKDSGGFKTLPMDHVSRLEMLCDWRGASRYYGGKDVVTWYQENKENMLFHPDTKAWIESQLGITEVVCGQEQ